MSDQDEDPSDEEKPENSGRWRKGQPSPNPAGRPPKETPKKSVEEPSDEHFLDKPITIRIGGEEKEMGLAEAVLATLVQKALKGDVASAQAVLRVDTARKKSGKGGKPPVPPLPPLIRFMKSSDTALEKLGFLTMKHETWLVCDWALEAAVARMIEHEDSLESLRTLYFYVESPDLWERLTGFTPVDAYNAHQGDDRNSDDN